MTSPPTQHRGATYDGHRVLLAFPYDRDLQTKVRTLTSTITFDAERRAYTFSAVHAAAVARFATDHNLPVLPPLTALLAAQHREREKVIGSPSTAVDEHSHVVIADGEIRMFFTATPSRTAKLRAAGFATFSRSTKLGAHWRAPLGTEVKAVAFADSEGLTVADDLRAAATARAATERRNLALSNAETTTTALQFTGMTTTLMPHQLVAVELTHTHRRIINADEQGLGKSIEALASARVAGSEARRVVIVCPSSLTGNWIGEMAEHFTPGTFTPHTCQGATPTDIPAGVDAVVIGWAVLQNWADVLIEWAPDMLVADEGHYAKSGRLKTRTEKKMRMVDQAEVEVTAAGKQLTTWKDGHVETIVVDDVELLDTPTGLRVTEKTVKVSGGAQRATAAIDLASQGVGSNGMIIALTGTPVINRPVELQALLDFLGILPKFGGEYGFKQAYCGPKRKQIGAGRTAWDYTGHSNLLELNNVLRSSGHFIRRTKALLIKQGKMQPKYVDGIDYYATDREPRPLTVPGDAWIMREYRAAERDLVSFLQAKAIEAAGGGNIDTQRIRQKVAALGGQHLQQIGVLRKLAAQAKVPYVISLTRSLIEQGEKVVIAAHHREVVDAYASAFGGVKIQGGMTIAAIEAAKEAFNELPVGECPVLVLAVEAGKTGHTLCKQRLHDAGPECTRMILAEQVWTPGDEAQVQDRIWRIGQTRMVRIANILVDKSIDRDVYDARRRKRAVVDALTDGVEEGLAAERAMAGQIAVALTYKDLGDYAQGCLDADRTA